jgi:adhesin HecA-like repeat protein
MNGDWQNAIVAAVVLGAVAYLARSAWRTLAARKAGCGACSTCPAEKPGAGAIVSLAALDLSAKQLANPNGQPIANGRSFSNAPSAANRKPTGC